MCVSVCRVSVYVVYKDMWAGFCIELLVYLLATWYIVYAFSIVLTKS